MTDHMSIEERSHHGAGPMTGPHMPDERGRRAAHDDLQQSHLPEPERPDYWPEGSHAACPKHAAQGYETCECPESSQQATRPYCQCEEDGCTLEHRPLSPATEAMVQAKLLAQNIGSGRYGGTPWREAHQLLRAAKLAGRLMEREGVGE